MAEPKAREHRTQGHLAEGHTDHAEQGLGAMGRPKFSKPYAMPCYVLLRSILCSVGNGVWKHGGAKLGVGKNIFGHGKTAFVQGENAFGSWKGHTGNFEQGLGAIGRPKPKYSFFPQDL